MGRARNLANLKPSSEGLIGQNDLASGVAGTGPAFRAFATSVQSISQGTFTKVNLQAENFDTASSFDTANSRFTPNVAGYYQINARIIAQAGTSITRVLGTIRVNGAEVVYGRHFDCPITSTNYWMFTMSELVYLNGTTDYVDLWVWMTSNGNATVSSVDANTCALSGSLVRAA